MRRILLVLMMAALLAMAAGCGEKVTPTSNVPTLAITPTSLITSTPRPTTAPGAATCRAVPSILESLPSVDGLPPLSDQDYLRGPADAPVTLIEYADFQ